MSMIYLDNNATTQVDPAVREAMLPWLGEQYGNPSAGYRIGKQSRKALETAREQVAALIDAEPGEIIFTSGGTESNTLAILSATRLWPERRGLVSSSVEHSAIHEGLGYFADSIGYSPDSIGYNHHEIAVDADGVLDLDAWRAALETGDVAMATLIWANNETGVLSPVVEAAEAARDAKVYFHTDAVQVVGKVPVSVDAAPLHSLAMSAHKFHGPKGIGALYVNKHARFQPSIFGGGQESERRSGTENVAAIVGMGVAADLARQRLDEMQSVEELRDRFERGVVAAIEGVEINGTTDSRLPNTTNLYFPGVDGEGLLILLDEAGVCCSPGSACSTGAIQPSRILKAMGQSSKRARSSVRFSLSHLSTKAEIDEAIAQIEKAVGKLRIVLPSRR